MARKFFVLRTNSLVSREGYSTLLSFGNDNQIIIPFPVLDQLEKRTHEYSQKGKNASAILEYLSNFKIDALLSEEGVKQKNGSTLRIMKECPDIEIELSGLNDFDRKCLQIVRRLQQANRKSTVILVTKNPALRLKANSIGIKAQNFRDDVFPELKDQYTGRVACSTSNVKLNSFFEEGVMPIKSIYKYTEIEWMPNLFLEIRAEDGNSAIGRFDGQNIVKLNYLTYHPYGVTPKNAGQEMLLEALLLEQIKLVIIKGGAGTGKTFMSLAVGLDQTFKASKKPYSQIMVTTPVETVGQERIGFLPGDIEEKFNPHLGGIRDNLRIILNQYGSKSDKSKDADSFLKTGKIQVQPIGFLRGRTIVDTYFIIDETQNISPDDIKSIVTRAGEGSKFIFLGDPTQIDNPQLNERYNGLVYLSERFKDDSMTCQITLPDKESVRSELARRAAEKL